MKYKFQFQNGNISEGSNTIYIRDGIAEVGEDLTPGLKLLIEAHGGQLVEEQAKTKARRESVEKVVSDGGT